MSSFVKIPCWYAMQLFFMFFEKRVAYFSCFTMFLGESRHKNNSFLLIWEIALHWEWNIFLRMQRFWTLETICVAWSKLPTRSRAKEYANLSRYTTQAMQPRRQSSLGHGLLRYTTQAMQPRRQSLLGHGLSPYKKTISHCFLRERAPDEAAWVCLFAWLQLSKLLVYYVNIFLACLDFYCKLIF